MVPAEEAIRLSFAVGSPIGYVEGGLLVREHPDGKREVVGSN